MSSSGKPLVPTVACSVAALLVLVAAIADYTQSVDDVPPISDPCQLVPGDPAVIADGPVLGDGCAESRNEQLAARIDRINEIDEAFERRLALYSLAIVAIGVAFLLLRLRTLPEGERRTAFTDLGIGAVLWLVVVLATFWAQQDSGRPPLDPSIGAPLAAGGALVLIAGLGSIGTWSRPPGGLGEEAAGLPPVVKAGAAVTAAAMLVSTVAAASRGECEDPRPDWLDGGFTVAFFLAAIAMLCGVLALFQRRWFAALLLLGIPLIWVFFAAFATACLN